MRNFIKRSSVKKFMRIRNLEIKFKLDGFWFGFKFFVLIFSLIFQNILAARTRDLKEHYSVVLNKRGGTYYCLCLKIRDPPSYYDPPGSKHERKKAHAQVRTLAERANTHLSSYALATRPSRPRYKHTSPVYHFPHMLLRNKLHSAVCFQR